ncbi:MAG: PD40 domain-containing protein [Prolixibacteraceae bacterium]|nr:PD40 domain-containing protein [Prolixibacteraceae bacterium]
MKSATFKLGILLLLFGAIFFFGCQPSTVNKTEKTERFPNIDPDYTNVTVPYNIAPLNFAIKEPGKSFSLSVLSDEGSELFNLKSSDGMVQFPEKKWRKILDKNRGHKLDIQISCLTGDESIIKNIFQSFSLMVSEDPIDPYLVYRIIHPGYYSWSNIKIEQRSLSSFRTESVIENQMIDKNCVNCHSFNKNNPDEFLIHIRGTKGGTYFSDENKILKTNLKTENMPGGATYPTWHPGGRFVAFSSNQVRQSFYAHREKSIEVYDLISSLILYDRQNNEITNITTQDTINPLQTFPSWSADGKYLYFCRAVQDQTNSGRDINDIRNIQYDLVRKPFQEETKLFGETEMVFNASAQNKSVSFPRISPNGRFLIFTLQDYGTFPIWHEEADLFIIDLQSGKVTELEVNSNKTESYHAWSSNGRWLVFSSKRMDGRSARPFFAHIDENGKAGKPFVLPQKKPTHYQTMLESFNIPELIGGKIKFSSRNFATAVNQEAIQGKMTGETSTIKIIKTENKNISEDKGIHE